MSSDSETPRNTVAAQPAISVRTNSYSRKRWNAFDMWQEHVRKSAATVDATLPERHDRDLRRTIIAG